MTIERHAAVIEFDLPEIYRYIARDNPGAADAVLDAVEATFCEIASHPECGVLYPGKNSRTAGLRMLPVSGFGNYLIFYRVEEQSVRVLHVVHGARDLARLFRRRRRA